MKRLLVANRSEIAIRIFRAATELGLTTVAVYADQDKLSLHRFKADEAYLIGQPHTEGDTALGPVEAYLSIDEIMRVAREAKIDAIHPGYGFLSESPEFAEACAEAGITFIGPTPKTMRTLGNKVSARNLAVSVEVPVMPATLPLPEDEAEITRMAEAIGYPVMLKASWGGGGRGMRPITDPSTLLDAVTSAKREAKSAFGKDEVYLEKLVVRAKHIEVQLLGDTHGNLVHLYERDCSIQRRNQKVVERAPAAFLDDATRQALCEAALRIGKATDYVGAGTVEFLFDADTDKFYFIEVNPRIQVEHTVTEVVTGIDIVKAQIGILDGGHIGNLSETGVPLQADIKLNGHAIQCRITTEDPDNKFIPDYGRITAYRGAFGFGVRIDGGTAYSGAIVTRWYDSLLEKITAWAPTPGEAIARMQRALREYRIRGVATNLAFLDRIVSHKSFADNSYTTKFIDNTPDLFAIPARKDRATRLLTYIADVSVNGHPEVKDRPKPRENARRPVFPMPAMNAPAGTRQQLASIGPKAFADWMRAETRVLVTDTAMRDGHQSLLATRMRTHDLVGMAPAYASRLPQLLSLECWGGATFDVSMRFLGEDPWERLRLTRERVPNLLLQMLLRGANGVGYKNYADNVVQHFVRTSAAAGVDLFRVFDCLNWIENMRVSIDAILETGKICEGAICYTGDVLDPKADKYTLAYYVGLAKELEKAGCHVLGLKDMAGLMTPAAAHKLVTTLRAEVGLPVHFHTHDTSGIGGAAILAAVDAGVDAVDLCMDALSGATSQPCLGSIVSALRHTERDTGLDPAAIREISFQWEAVRGLYEAFEGEHSSPASEVYQHEMPGGQFTNLKEQARSLGLEERWHDVAKTYAAANQMFGDIIKVTPSSKVVGDMALMMVSNGLTVKDVLDPEVNVAFPASVIDMLRGDLGQPTGGWPEALQKKALKGEAPIEVRPASLIPPVDLDAARTTLSESLGHAVSEEELASSLMYPKVFEDFRKTSALYGPIATLPTPTAFYGMQPAEEINVALEQGKSMLIHLATIGETDADGNVKVFFELNGQPRIISVPDRKAGVTTRRKRVAEDGNTAHVAAPMPGRLVSFSVKEGDTVEIGKAVGVLEAMKMETVLHAQSAGKITEILVKAGDPVDAKDLIMTIEA
jgi:pyruvate carboxylase